MTKREAKLVLEVLSYMVTQMPPAESAVAIAAREAARRLAHEAWLALPANAEKLQPDRILELWPRAGMSPLAEKMGLAES